MAYGDPARLLNTIQERADSLGRVLFAKQPEQDTNTAPAFTATDPITGNTVWSVRYSYDDNGNILTTTDARNISIAGTYDQLDRLKTRDYSDPNTPDVSFYYDGKGLGFAPGSEPANSKGKTTKVASTVSESRNTSFDQMGRLLTSEQRTTAEQFAGTQAPYAFTYVYNLSSALIEETYPSGRVVKTTLNADGELSQVQSKKNSNHGFFTYADSITYNPSGSVTKLQLGNGKWETAVYNERLQVSEIGLGSTPQTQDLLKLEFKYTTTPTSADNNGSMREQKITVPTAGANAGFTATQTYTYDSLNRIQSATENLTPTGGTATQTWKQTFDIDRYGNRRFDPDAADTTTLNGCDGSVCNPEINTSNNRLKKDQVGGTSVDYDYDANGALIKDFTGQRFGYDAESHQKEFFSASNQTTTPDATYEYDGEGRRVKKIVGSEMTIFVYDASGLLAAEYSTTVVPEAQAKVSYLTADHLGSPRIITDQNGAVISRKDFTAFGETVTSSQRVSGMNGNGYDPPNVRQDYTGYQKDYESELEFAQARYYDSHHGRFTSVDPTVESLHTGNPQTFNRFAYVGNSPYKFTDPLGLMGCSAEYASCDTSNGNFSPPSDKIIIKLNIVYDKSQYTKEQAQKALKATVDDLTETFAAINVSFDISYSEGTASSVRDSSGVPERISTGYKDGAVNAFFFANNKTGGKSQSAYVAASKQIFLWEGSVDISPSARNVSDGLSSHALAHETSHLFLDFAGAPQDYSMSNNIRQDIDVGYATNQMRLNPLFYRDPELPDDFDYQKDIAKPGIVNQTWLVNRKTKAAPTAEQLIRLGARRVSAQWK